MVLFCMAYVQRKKLKKKAQEKSQRKKPKKKAKEKSQRKPQ